DVDSRDLHRRLAPGGSRPRRSAQSVALLRVSTRPRPGDQTPRGSRPSLTWLPPERAVPIVPHHGAISLDACHLPHSAPSPRPQKRVLLWGAGDASKLGYPWATS